MSLALDYLAKCSLVNRASCPDLAEFLLFEFRYDIDMDLVFADTWIPNIAAFTKLI